MSRTVQSSSLSCLFQHWSELVLVSSLDHKFLQIFKVFWRHPPATQTVSLCSLSVSFDLCELPAKTMMFHVASKEAEITKSSPERDFFLSQKDIMQMMVVRRTRRADTQRRKVNLDLLLVLNPVLCILYGKDRHGSKWQNWESNKLSRQNTQCGHHNTEENTALKYTANQG